MGIKAVDYIKYRTEEFEQNPGQIIISVADAGYLPGNHRAVSVRLEAVDDDLFDMHLQ